MRKNMQNGRGHSVLDIGCGKGFVLYFLSGLCFDEVAGVEYDKDLSRIAGRNLRKTSGNVNGDSKKSGGERSCQCGLYAAHVSDRDHFCRHQPDRSNQYEQIICTE